MILEVCARPESFREYAYGTRLSRVIREHFGRLGRDVRRFLLEAMYDPEGNLQYQQGYHNVSEKPWLIEPVDRKFFHQIPTQYWAQGLEKQYLDSDDNEAARRYIGDGFMGAVAWKYTQENAQSRLERLAAAEQELARKAQDGSLTAAQLREEMGKLHQEKSYYQDQASKKLSNYSVEMRFLMKGRPKNIFDPVHLTTIPNLLAIVAPSREVEIRPAPEPTPNPHYGYEYDGLTDPDANGRQYPLSGSRGNVGMIPGQPEGFQTGVYTGHAEIFSRMFTPLGEPRRVFSWGAPGQKRGKIGADPRPIVPDDPRSFLGRADIPGGTVGYHKASSRSLGRKNVKTPLSQGEEIFGRSRGDVNTFQKFKAQLFRAGSQHDRIARKKDLRMAVRLLADRWVRQAQEIQKERKKRTPSTFGSKLRADRERRGWTTQDLAAFLDQRASRDPAATSWRFTPELIDAWESGKAVPQEKLLNWVTRYLGWHSRIELQVAPPGQPKELKQYSTPNREVYIDPVTGKETVRAWRDRRVPVGQDPSRTEIQRAVESPMSDARKQRWKNYYQELIRYYSNPKNLQAQYQKLRADWGDQWSDSMERQWREIFATREQRLENNKRRLADLTSDTTTEPTPLRMDFRDSGNQRRLVDPSEPEYEKGTPVRYTKIPGQQRKRDDIPRHIPVEIGGKKIKQVERNRFVKVSLQNVYHLTPAPGEPITVSEEVAAVLAEVDRDPEQGVGELSRIVTSKSSNGDRLVQMHYGKSRKTKKDEEAKALRFYLGRGSLDAAGKLKRGLGDYPIYVYTKDKGFLPCMWALVDDHERPLFVYKKHVTKQYQPWIFPGAINSQMGNNPELIGGLDTARHGQRQQFYYQRQEDNERTREFYEKTIYKAVGKGIRDGLGKFAKSPEIQDSMKLILQQMGETKDIKNNDIFQDALMYVYANLANGKFWDFASGTGVRPDLEYTFRHFDHLKALITNLDKMILEVQRAWKSLEKGQTKYPQPWMNALAQVIPTDDGRPKSTKDEGDRNRFLKFSQMTMPQIKQFLVGLAPVLQEYPELRTRYLSVTLPTRFIGRPNKQRNGVSYDKRLESKIVSQTGANGKSYRFWDFAEDRWVYDQKPDPKTELGLGSNNARTTLVLDVDGIHALIDNARKYFIKNAAKDVFINAIYKNVFKKNAHQFAVNDAGEQVVDVSEKANEAIRKHQTSPGELSHGQGKYNDKLEALFDYIRVVYSQERAEFHQLRDKLEDRPGDVGVVVDKTAAMLKAMQYGAYSKSLAILVNDARRKGIPEDQQYLWISQRFPHVVKDVLATPHDVDEIQSDVTKQAAVPPKDIQAILAEKARDVLHPAKPEDKKSARAIQQMAFTLITGEAYKDRFGENITRKDILETISKVSNDEEVVFFGRDKFLDSLSYFAIEEIKAEIDLMKSQKKDKEYEKKKKTFELIVKGLDQDNLLPYFVLEAKRLLEDL